MYCIRNQNPCGMLVFFFFHGTMLGPQNRHYAYYWFYHNILNCYCLWIFYSALALVLVFWNIKILFHLSAVLEWFQETSPHLAHLVEYWILTEISISYVIFCIVLMLSYIFQMLRECCNFNKSIIYPGEWLDTFLFLVVLCLCICFIDWQKAFDRVNWTKLMQILKRTGIDWRERRLISKLYMDQKVKVRLDRGETRSVQIGRGVRQGCYLSPILFNLYSEWLTKEALDGLGDFSIGGQIIQTEICRWPCTNV